MSDCERVHMLFKDTDGADNSEERDEILEG